MYDYTKIDKKVFLIIKKVISYLGKYVSEETIKEEILKAYAYAKQAHEGQFRHSGDPYIVHPIGATFHLLSLKPDIPTIQACILHDVIEDTDVSLETIKNEFGEEVAFLCAGMEKLSKVRYHGEEREVGSLRKMFVAMAQDLRVVFIKLADRLHNMQTLRYHPKRDKREKIALETLNIYAPIADRLGLYSLKNALEEECFKILEAEAYKKIKKEMAELNESIDSFSKNAEKEIKDVLIDGGIKNFEIDYRVKSIYSIYKKMKRKGYESIKSLYDLFGIRIIVKDVTTCYKALGVIHNYWTPLPNRFKDYIALPKPNGYKSLHTTIIGLLKNYRKQPTEIQIKTYEMKEYSDIGVAAHFEYKERGSKVAHDIGWVKDLKDITESLENQDFMTSIKIDVFKDRIFVFTPKGDSINLPQGSTPVDYAYAIHTELGDHISLAKVSGKVYPLDKELRNGDIIEIIIDKNRNPSPFWLSFVKTAKARDKIKAYLRKDNKYQNRDRGKEIVNKYLQNAGLGILDKDLSILKILDGRENSVDERNFILEQVGNFSLSPGALMRRILKAQNKKIPSTRNKENFGTKENQIKSSEENQEIIIGGEKNIPYKLCYCCRRKIPSKIVAHINSKGIITLHKRDCKILENVNKERLLPAYIKGEETNSITAHINFLFQNKIGVLKEISDILYSMHINVEQISSKKEAEEKTLLSFILEIPDYDYLIVERLIERIKFHFGEMLLDSQVLKIES
ncbi:bifunctional (p)ppGpp synthetase/guanosine-3',5'-bis(diphosphate) 3'-pyrophosphohydrolase [Candidatus Gracilibacteria bacterium]|nr:bifunctional (p)ppGpp synthetase/guanosine-3',5'-bis(diphosphate) 3'-pyrophosphohydrolase [Candidatus Gracilibacteria bacterium]NUJ99450.1 bifunctional (p)ppGpp synthetase/guanosine-3',5'-bis(diphosphate) 3'-pyrophosphohydrolase [Candidatus Gracilibacteria bacterium]